jgi:hypothetical protein
MRQTLIDAYLDYVNNYLTVKAYAEHNGLTLEQGQRFIQLAKEVYESVHPDA